MKHLPTLSVRIKINIRTENLVLVLRTFKFFELFWKRSKHVLRLTFFHNFEKLSEITVKLVILSIL